MMTDNRELKNVFKADDKNGQIVFSALKEMLNKIDTSIIKNILVDTACMNKGYLSNKIMISIDTKSGITDSFCDEIWNTEQAIISKIGEDVCIGIEHPDDYIGYLILY